MQCCWGKRVYELDLRQISSMEPMHHEVRVEFLVFNLFFVKSDVICLTVNVEGHRFKRGCGFEESINFRDRETG